nr:hypothetical protein [Tanacetum cinerariifolium]
MKQLKPSGARPTWLNNEVAKGSPSGTAQSKGKDHGFPIRQDIYLFNLIRAPNPTKVKTGTRPRAAHEVPLLTVTASRVIEMEDLAAAIDYSGVPSTIERLRSGRVAPEVPPPENVTTTRVPPEAGQAEEIVATGPRVIKECRKRGNNGVDTNAPPKVLRRDHADPRPTQSTIGGKSLAAIGLGMGSTCPVPTSWDTHMDVSDPDPLTFANPQSSKGAAVAGDPKSENTSFTSMVGSPESIYRPEWSVTNGCRLDAPKACQDLVDHIAPPGYFSELHYLHNDDFLKQYNINLAWQVAIGLQLHLRIQARENEINNLEALLEAETDMKKTAEAKNAELGKELETPRALFSYLQ